MCSACWPASCLRRPAKSRPSAESCNHQRHLYQRTEQSALLQYLSIRLAVMFSYAITAAIAISFAIAATAAIANDDPLISLPFYFALSLSLSLSFSLSLYLSNLPPTLNPDAFSRKLAHQLCRTPVVPVVATQLVAFLLIGDSKVDGVASVQRLAAAAVVWGYGAQPVQSSCIPAGRR